MAEAGWPLIPREVLPAPVEAVRRPKRPLVHVDAGRQLSIFGAETTDPSPADLAGLLAGPGRLGRMGGTARISVTVDAAWRVHVLVSELVARGLVVTWLPIYQDQDQADFVREIEAPESATDPRGHSQAASPDRPEAAGRPGGGRAPRDTPGVTGRERVVGGGTSRVPDSADGADRVEAAGDGDGRKPVAGGGAGQGLVAGDGGGPKPVAGGGADQELVAGDGASRGRDGGGDAGQRLGVRPGPESEDARGGGGIADDGAGQGSVADDSVGRGDAADDTDGRGATADSGAGRGSRAKGRSGRSTVKSRTGRGKTADDRAGQTRDTARALDAEGGAGRAGSGGGLGGAGGPGGVDLPGGGPGRNAEGGAGEVGEQRPQQHSGPGEQQPRQHQVNHPEDDHGADDGDAGGGAHDPGRGVLRNGRAGQGRVAEGGAGRVAGVGNGAGQGRGEGESGRGGSRGRGEGQVGRRGDEAGGDYDFDAVELDGGGYGEDSWGDPDPDSGGRPIGGGGSDVSGEGGESGHGGVSSVTARDRPVAAPAFFEVRTAYSSRLIGLARAWPPPSDRLFLSGPRLRLWVAAAGFPYAGGYALGLDPVDNPEIADAALVRAGLAGTVSDQGLHYLITGRKRLRRLAELVGERPAAAPAELWPGGAAA